MKTDLDFVQHHCSLFGFLHDILLFGLNTFDAVIAIRKRRRSSPPTGNRSRKTAIDISWISNSSSMNWLLKSHLVFLMEFFEVKGSKSAAKGTLIKSIISRLPYRLGDLANEFSPYFSNTDMLNFTEEQKENDRKIENTFISYFPFLSVYKRERSQHSRTATHLEDTQLSQKCELNTRPAKIQKTTSSTTTLFLDDPVLDLTTQFERVLSNVSSGIVTRAMHLGFNFPLSPDTFQRLFFNSVTPTTRIDRVLKVFVVEGTRIRFKVQDVPLLNGQKYMFKLFIPYRHMIIVIETDFSQKSQRFTGFFYPGMRTDDGMMYHQEKIVTPKKNISIDSRLTCKEHIFFKNDMVLHFEDEQKFSIIQRRFPVIFLVCFVGRILNKAAIIESMHRRDTPNAIPPPNTRLRLECPISGEIPRLPCRGNACTHIQCFDAAAWFDYCHVRKDWMCPHCFKPLHPDDVGVDRLLYDKLVLNSMIVDDIEECDVFAVSKGENSYEIEVEE
ncbi:hypothetical protein PCE1_000124 [Barthelona sp. PCE]